MASPRHVLESDAITLIKRSRIGGACRTTAADFLNGQFIALIL